MHKNEKGFSLIELIVVMTIVAVITVIGVVSFSAAGVKSRDGRRMADLSKIQVALELYRQAYGSYPQSVSVVANLVPTYLQAWPTDPKGSGFATYSYVSSGNPAFSYSLMAYMEDTSTYNVNTGYQCGTNMCNYVVVNP